ncbi:hypothetical protein ASPNIDRAFT_35961 [Aspergillus niger ATCC 1015]|uniref:Uncharacterized protein n=1 Tax=Aspergillus niger (strain ATCC 1015 / CBS 113.46 / FGSC A1144 / LSHB Ac4 / NCTC 3858a / NRRL 328 / USDA 3528.7) TaxID=380704 RepID=G3XSY9_ASPNA|nr:hypothetical protein ASPNIDRAFT_35961 [Aspergillus niger ATCC 1015]
MLLACLSGPSAMMSLGLLQPGIRNRNLVRLFLVSDSTGTGNGSNPHAIPNLVLGHRPQKGHFPRIVSRAKLNSSSSLIRLANKNLQPADVRSRGLHGNPACLVGPNLARRQVKSRSSPHGCYFHWNLSASLVLPC